MQKIKHNIKVFMQFALAAKHLYKLHSRKNFFQYSSLHYSAIMT